MMRPELIVNPTDLRDFAKTRGWALVPEAVKDRLYVLNHPRFHPRQLAFPMDTWAPDYVEAVRLTLQRLAEAEATPVDQVFAGVLGFREDTLRFRILLEQDDAGLPLPLAASMVAGAEQLLRAAACTVVKPQRHHQRLTRTEAQEIAEAARFRHTQPGSFVLRVSCPVNAVDAHPTLLPGEEEGPFVRRTTRMLAQAIGSLIQSIEADDVEAIVGGRSGESTIVSSNLCEALGHFHDPALKNSLELEVDWAASLPEPTRRRRIRIQRDCFARIDEIRLALRRVESDVPDTFVGTVEHLAGEMGDDGRRAGEVVLALLIEGEVVRARVQLDAQQYSEADRAHMIDGAYVQVTGKLKPGRQPRSLVDLSSFQVLWPKGQ